MLQFFDPKFWPHQSLMEKTLEVCFSQKMSEMECLVVYVVKCLGECLVATLVENTRALHIPPASPSSPMSIPYIPLH